MMETNQSIMTKHLPVEVDEVEEGEEEPLHQLNVVLQVQGDQ